jgi:hypothetical protein
MQEDMHKIFARGFGDYRKIKFNKKYRNSEIKIELQ